jgi:hypothetical protein
LSARGTSTLLNNALLSAHFRIADYTSRVNAIGCGIIDQMDPSGVFVNPDNFEGGFPNFTNLPLPPTVDGATPPTASCRRTAVIAGSFPEERRRSKFDPRRQKCKIAVVLVSQKGSFR